MGYKHSSGEFLVDAYIMRHHRSRLARAAVHMMVSPECDYFLLTISLLTVLPRRMMYTPPSDGLATRTPCRL